MPKARFSDIAAAAGVGTATVERVLNARGNVAPATVEKVVLAARRLGLDRRIPELHHGTIRIEAIMVRPDTPFFRRLNDAFAGIASTLDSSVVLHRTFLDESDPASVARHIAKPGFRRSGLIIVAPDHPEVKKQLRLAKAAGTQIVHIVSRVGDEGSPFVGIDNYAAGRTAGFYLTGLLAARAGTILALCHSAVYDVHKERIRGFSDFLRERGKAEHVFAAVLFGRDDTLQTADLLEQALRREPDIIGLYNAGGAADGVAAVLNRAGRSGKILWIGHELTGESRRWLRSGLMGLVLDQAPEIQARRAVEFLLHRLGLLEAAPPQTPVPFLTFNRENA